MNSTKYKDAFSSYRKLFIHDVLKKASDEKSTSSNSRFIMKAHVMGLIISMKKYQQRTIFCVDDGTGQLECVLWHNESSLLTRISDLKKALAEGTGTLCDETGALTSLLNKVELNEIDPEEKYKPGNMIALLGILKTFRGRFELSIRHHYKLDDMNAESLWILNVLTIHKNNIAM